jgi:hypothetical protein
MPFEVVQLRESKNVWRDPRGDRSRMNGDGRRSVGLFFLEMFPNFRCSAQRHARRCRTTNFDPDWNRSLLTKVKLACNTGPLTARRNSMRLPQQIGVSVMDITRDISIIFHLIVNLPFPPSMYKTGVANLAVFGRDWGPLATEFGPTRRRHFVPLPPSSARPLMAGLKYKSLHPFTG